MEEVTVRRTISQVVLASIAKIQASAKNQTRPPVNTKPLPNSCRNQVRRGNKRVQLEFCSCTNAYLAVGNERAYLLQRLYIWHTYIAEADLTASGS